MPSPAITLRLKRFRHRFGVAAPRVAIRTHFCWHWYAAGLLALVVLVAAGTWWLAQHDEVVHMKAEMLQHRQLLEEANAELAQLRAEAGTEQSAVRMERSTQRQLLARLKVVEEENATLKADLAFFEKLVPAVGVESVLRVERLSLVSGSEPGKYRYRLLAAFQPSKEQRAFRGRLQLMVHAVQGGRDIVLPWPPAGREGEPEFILEMQHFLRKEGSLHIPVGARVKSIEARILQGDTVKARKIVTY